MKRSSDRVLFFHCKVSFSSLYRIQLVCTESEAISIVVWAVAEKWKVSPEGKDVATEMQSKDEREEEYKTIQPCRKIAFRCHFVTPCWLLSARILCFCQQLLCLYYVHCAKTHIELQRPSSSSSSSFSRIDSERFTFSLNNINKCKRYICFLFCLSSSCTIIFIHWRVSTLVLAAAVLRHPIRATTNTCRLIQWIENTEKRQK